MIYGDEEIAKAEHILDMVRNMDNINILEYNDILELVQMAIEISNNGCDLNIENKVAQVLYKMSFSEKLELPVVWMIYMNLIIYCFKNIDIDNSIKLNHIYRHIFNIVKNSVDIKFNYKYIKKRNFDVVVVLTSQFLGSKHSPSIRVLDYSYEIQKKFNKRVVIINDSGFHFNYYFDTDVHFSYIDELEAYQSINYKDTSFIFYQNPDLMPNIKSIAVMCNMIYEINPLYVYNIGGDSLVGDICNEFTTVMSLPCSYDFPRTVSNYLLVGRKLNSGDSLELADLTLNQKVIETEINYVKATNCSENYVRSDFGLGEDKFIICIVGNRLIGELVGILELLNAVANMDNVEIALIGMIEDKTGKLSSIQNHNNIKCCSLILEASELIDKCDLYLNPKRKGGGRSAFEALSSAIPVVTLRYGDVFYTAGEEFAVESYQDMVEVILKYSTDKLFYEKMSNKALERAKELSDLEDSIGAAVNKVMNFEMEKESNEGKNKNES